MDEVAIRRPRDESGPGVASTVGCCLSLDLDGTVVWAARAAREVLAWTPDELSGRNVTVVAPGLGQLLGQEDSAQILSSGADGSTVVDVGVRRDGRSFEASINLAPRRSPSGDVVGMTVVIHDATADLSLRRSRRLGRDREPVLILGRALDIRHATPAASRLLGLRPEDLFPHEPSGLVHPSDLPAISTAVERLLADPRRVERLVMRMRDAVARWRPVEVTLSNCLDDPDLRGVVARLQDVTERVRAQDEARLSAALHRAMVETSEEGIVVTDHDGATRYANLATEQLLGIPVDRLDGVDMPTLLGSGDRARTEGGARKEIVYAHPDGLDRILAVTSSPLGDDGTGLGSLFTIADVTESRISERDLRRRALYDPLTGLPNRYLVRDRLEMAAARHARTEGASTAVLFIDLDGFKQINDTYGHDAGDALLRQVAERITAAVRATDTAGRVGGDEFVVICEDVDTAGTSFVSARIQLALKQPFDLGQVVVGIDASIGVALSPPYPIEQLIQEADGAMYRTKRAGGGSTTFAES